MNGMAQMRERVEKCAFNLTQTGAEMKSNSAQGSSNVRSHPTSQTTEFLLVQAFGSRTLTSEEVLLLLLDLLIPISIATTYGKVTHEANNHTSA